MLILPKAVGCLVQACAKETARYAMTGIRVAADLHDQWWLEATNGRILAIARGPLIESGGGPDLELVDPLEEFLVSQEDWKRIFSAIPAKDPLGKGCVGIGADPHNIHVSTPNGRLIFQHLDGRYPDVMQVVPTMGSACTATVDPWLLIDLLRICIGIGESKDGTRVVLHFHGHNRPLCLTTRNEENHNTLDGLIMPCSQD